MQRLKNFAIPSLIMALVLFPLTTSSQDQENSSEFSPLRTSRPAPQQRPINPSTKFVKSKRPIPNRYIVVLDDDIVPNDRALEVKREQIAAIANSHAQPHGGTVDYIYETALKGYAVELPNEAAAIAISKMPRVRWVEENALGESNQAPASPQPSPPWGLDSLDSGLPVPSPNPTTGRTNGFYNFGANGSGVKVYVVDSGINTGHVEFLTPSTTRAMQAADCFNFVNCVSGQQTSYFNQQACVHPMPNPSNNDCHGHGTYVAGILGGNTYGVAKNVMIRAVKVGFNSVLGGYPLDATIMGVNWVTGQHQANPSTPSVANMSLGFPTSQGLETVISNSLAAGVTWVASAGNNNVDARNQAPADVTAAITVGAVNWNGNRWFASNWGIGVDLFAPGEQVVSALTGNGLQTQCGAWNGTNATFCIASGTSAAAPHVAGAVAMYLQGRPSINFCGSVPIQGPAPATANVSTCPDRVARFINANTVLSRLTNINGTIFVGGVAVTVPSPNRFLSTGAIPAPANPIDNQRFFVWSHYPDFLGRSEPDEGGLDHWTRNITGPCGTGVNVNNTCTREWRIHTSRAFWVARFPSLFNAQGGTTNNSEFVHRCYEIYLQRSVPDTDAGFQHWLNDLSSQYGNPASYEGVNHIIDAFLISPEYRRRFGLP
jgi:subtilisin family serine protease